MWMSRKTTSIAVGSSGPRSSAGSDPAQRLGGAGRALGAADPRVGAEQVQQLFEGGLFVVDGQGAQHDAGAYDLVRPDQGWA